MTGELARFGAQTKHGAEQAVADINAHWGVLGRQIRLVVGDDRCDPKRAPDTARDLADQHVVFVAGHFCSGASIRASRVYHESGILQITPASSNPRLTDEAAATGWTNVFCLYVRDDEEGSIAGAWIAGNTKGRNVTIVDDRSGLGRLVAGAAQQAMNRSGLRETLRHSYSPKAYGAAGDLVGKLKSAKISILYFGGSAAAVAEIVREARDIKLALQLVASDMLNSPEFAAAGAGGGGAMFVADADSPDYSSARTVVAELQKASMEPESYVLNNYAAVELWAEAAAKAGTTEANKVAQILRDGSWNTILGTVTFDAKGDVIKPNTGWYVYRNGSFSQVKM
ncbi:MAG: branched-chain amino acid transport system substrate-binding protein [Rhodospirillaceae bacterium]|jgi:branched-chain amino acid transport system substrate-binding protein|nr:branched-chain amino acid transport system substrate-binding protein [Rhodospirillaceae bacterium]